MGDGSSDPASFTVAYGWFGDWASTYREDASSQVACGEFT